MGQKKILGLKTFGPKKFWAKINFVSEKFSKKFVSEKN